MDGAALIPVLRQSALKWTVQDVGRWEHSVTLKYFKQRWMQGQPQWLDTDLCLATGIKVTKLQRSGNKLQGRMAKSYYHWWAIKDVIWEGQEWINCCYWGEIDFRSVSLPIVKQVLFQNTVRTPKPHVVTMWHLSSWVHACVKEHRSVVVKLNWIAFNNHLFRSSAVQFAGFVLLSYLIQEASSVLESVAFDLNTCRYK